jgi:hypothetical protein
MNSTEQLSDEMVATILVSLGMNLSLSQDLKIGSKGCRKWLLVWILTEDSGDTPKVQGKDGD